MVGTVFKRVNGFIDWMLLAAFVLLGLVGAYMTIDAYHLRAVTGKDSFYVFRPDKAHPEAYMKLSDEAIGWITIHNTTIDYPLMQTSNNSKYLNTAPDGSYSLAGSIFLDWQCDPLFKTEFGLIYGHHMTNGLMFGALDAFYEEEYFNTHHTGTIMAGGQEEKLHIFAFMLTDAHQRVIFDPTNHSGQYDFIKKHSMYFREPENKERIVALATCKEPGSTARTVLFCTIGE